MSDALCPPRLTACVGQLDGQHSVSMDKHEFAIRFALAATFCRNFTQFLIIEQLPMALRFNFARADGLPLDSEGCVKFIGGRLLKPEELKGLEGARAGQLLWVDSKIPRWVNLTVADFDECHTYIEIQFGELTANHEHLYYELEGNPPFHVLGPSGAKPGYQIPFRGSSTINDIRVEQKQPAMRHVRFLIRQLEVTGKGEALVGGHCCGAEIRKGDRTTAMVRIDGIDGDGRVIRRSNLLIIFHKIRAKGKEVDVISVGGRNLVRKRIR